MQADSCVRARSPPALRRILGGMATVLLANLPIHAHGQD